MKRKEFRVKSNTAIDKLLTEAQYGVLGLADRNNKPYTVALNFVWQDKKIYLHCSPIGKKIDILNINNSISFTVVQDLSFIPSYFSDLESACPASQYFLSVHIDGSAHFIESMEDKAKVLTGLMKKYQPEKGYKDLSPDDPLYTKMFKKVTVIEIIPKELSAKFKLGQNLTQEKFLNLINQLEKRNSSLDHLTIALMREYYSNIP